MKKGLIFFFLIGALNTLGQWSVDFRYLYFQNTQVNKAVEAMNLSHSFLDEGTQYVHHGYGIALNKYLKVSGPRGIYVRLEMPYQRLDQWSQWGTVNRKFNTSQLGLNAQLIFNPKAIKGKMTTGPLGPRFYFMAGAGYHFWQSQIKVDGEISYTSERRAYPTFSAGMGHRMFLIGTLCAISICKLANDPRMEQCRYAKSHIWNCLARSTWNRGYHSEKRKEATWFSEKSFPSKSKIRH